MLNRLNQWLAEPQQALLSAEIDWLKRWAFRGKGLALIIILVVLSFIPFAGMLSGLFYLGVWLWLFQLRTTGRFAKANLQELMVTPIDGAMIWPAFLLAPLCWFFLCDLIAIPAGLWQGFFMINFFGLLSGESLLSSLQLIIQTVGRLPLELAASFCATVLVARYTAPKSSFGRLLITTILVFILIGILSGILSGIVAVPISFLTQGSDLLSSLATAFIVYPLAAALLAFVGYKVLQGMRHPAGWDRLLNETYPLMPV